MPALVFRADIESCLITLAGIGVIRVPGRDGIPWNKGLTKEIDPRVTKNHVAWNEGLTKDTDPRLADVALKISKARIGKHYPKLSEAKLGVKNPKLSEARLGKEYPKLSEVKKGKPTWNKGITGYHTTGHPQSYYDSRARSLAATRHAVLIKPTRPEIELGNLIESACPGEYRYTGDFSFIVMGICPDYVNTNGQKKVIEMFGDHWHSEGSDKDRIEKFKAFGYDCLVIWQSELKSKSKDELVAQIHEFNGRQK